jgi:hypothetical protein
MLVWCRRCGVSATGSGMCCPCSRDETRCGGRPRTTSNAEAGKVAFELGFPVVEGYQDPGIVNVAVDWDSRVAQIGIDGASDPTDKDLGRDVPLALPRSAQLVSDSAI